MSIEFGKEKSASGVIHVLLLVIVASDLTRVLATGRLNDMDDGGHR